MMLPLEGIKVVEIAQNIAGPYASEILATLGADVVKIERKEGGDDARGWGPPFKDGVAATFHTVNRNKRGITLDLKGAKDIAWLKTYLRACDVFLENMRPGSLNELGLDANTLQAVNPRLIYCSLSAFGHKGPLRLKPGYEPILQAYAGLFSVNGTQEARARVGMQVLDLGSGVWAALGCIAALFQRVHTGIGSMVDVSLFETALGWLTVHFAGFKMSGQLPERHRSGNPRVVVFQAFDCSDGEIVVAAANDRLFVKFAHELGRPDWASDVRYKTNALRVANKSLLIPQIEAIISTRARAEWMERLEAAGIPCAPIHDLAEVAKLEQTAALGIVQSIPDVGLEVVGLPLSFDGVRPAIRSRAPHLGEHNSEILDTARGE